MRIASAQQSPTISGLSHDVTTDFKYLANNGIMDGEDIVGTTELFIHLHKLHDREPSRWRIFPISAAPGQLSQSGISYAAGLGVKYSW